MPVPLIDKIKPKNGGKFAIADAEDIDMPNGKRLDKFAEDTETRMSALESQKVVFLTEDEYFALLDAGEIDEETKYMIIEEE